MTFTDVDLIAFNLIIDRGIKLVGSPTAISVSPNDSIPSHFALKPPSRPIGITGVRKEHYFILHTVDNYNIWIFPHNRSNSCHANIINFQLFILGHTRGSI